MIDVNEIIRQRYINPIHRKRKDFVGIEFEFPIVHFGNQPVDFALIQDMNRTFIREFGFEQYNKDDNGRIFQAQKSENGDDLSFDCSFNTLEFSFGVESDMNIIYRRFREYYTFIEDFLAPHDHTLTGMGTNPNYLYNENISIANGRYYCSRDHFWRDSMQGYNLHNLDMHETQLHSLDEIVDYISTESVYCLEWDGKYINFPPAVLTDYFSAENIHGEYWDGEQYQAIAFQPRPEDIAYHRSYEFEDLTFRGTIEFRSCCEQPVSDVMTVAAYFAGPMEALPELKGLLENDTSLYEHGYNASEFRRMINENGLPEFADPEEVSRVLQSVLDPAHNGLRRRGYGEEHFLTPLYERAKTLENPAKRIEAELKNGVAKDEIVRGFAKL